MTLNASRGPFEQRFATRSVATNATAIQSPSGGKGELCGSSQRRSPRSPNESWASKWLTLLRIACSELPASCDPGSVRCRIPADEMLSDWPDGVRDPRRSSSASAVADTSQAQLMLISTSQVSAFSDDLKEALKATSALDKSSVKLVHLDTHSKPPLVSVA